MKPAFDISRLEGNFGLSALPSVLLGPCRGRLSGVLWFEREDAVRRIVFSAGWPIAASSNAADEQIEAHLLNTGQLDAPRLQRAIAHSTAKKVELQQALSDLSLLSKTTFVDQLLSLRKKIVTAALSKPCRTRFEPSATDPVGFSYLPLLECCAAAVAKWPTPDQQAALQAAGPAPLSVHDSDAELAMTLGAPKTMLAIMQSLTKEPKTAAQLVNSSPNARAELVAAIAAGIIQRPRDLLPIDGDLDAELGDALRAAQTRARPSFDAPLLPAVPRKRPNIVGIAAAVAISAVLSVTATWLAVRAPAPVVVSRPIVDPPPDPPASQPSSQVSILTSAGEKAQKPVAPRVKLTPEEKARVEALFKRGTASMKKRKIDLAIKDYKAALEIDPMSASGHRALAIALTRAGELEQAIFEYKVYLRLAPGADDRDSVQDIIDAYEAQRR